MDIPLSSGGFNHKINRYRNRDGLIRSRGSNMFQNGGETSLPMVFPSQQSSNTGTSSALSTPPATGSNSSSNSDGSNNSTPLVIPPAIRNGLATLATASSLMEAEHLVVSRSPSSPLVYINIPGVDQKSGMDSLSPSLASLSGAANSAATVLTPTELQQLAANGRLVTGQNGQLFMVMPSDSQALAAAAAAAAGIASAPPSPHRLHHTTTSKVGAGRGSSGTNTGDLTNSGSDCSNSGTGNGFMESLNLESKDIRRRVSHNEVERRRRDRINAWIGDLQKLLPPDEQARSQHQSKGAILKRVFEYFQALTSDLGRLQASHPAADQAIRENRSLHEAVRALREENQRLRNMLCTTVQVSSKTQELSQGITNVSVANSNGDSATHPRDAEERD